MNSEELETLKNQILESIIPMAVESSQNNFDRFELLIRLIHSGNANKDIYQKAYDAAQGIEDPDEKLSAMLQLLDEIELDLQDALQGDSSPQAG